MAFESLQDDIACTRFAGLERNLCSKRFSDFQIVCGEHTFCVHRIVLAHRSDYFWVLTTSDFSEAQQLVAHFPDEDPSLIARFIYFMYTGKLLSMPLTETRIEQFEDIDDPYMCGDQTLMLAANIYSLAIKYGARDLARLASCKFRTSICKQFHLLPDWTQLVAFIYESTPPEARDLRNVIVKRLQKNIFNRKRHSCPDTTELVEVVNQVPALAVDLALIHFTEKQYICSECKTKQSVLDFPCTHGKAHKTGDEECFGLNLQKQECYRCHELDTLVETVPIATVVDW